MKVQLVPGFADNYFFLVKCLETGKNIVVDPGDPIPVLAALGTENLDGILCTHHHADHVGGIAKLAETFHCPVYASAIDIELGRIPVASAIPVREGSHISIGGLNTQVLFVPGHTSGHMAYHFAADRMLCAGDTLFAGGCGRVFDGTLQDLYDSLQKLKTLPNDTSILCAHEYTLDNLEFAMATQPDEKIYRLRFEDVLWQRHRGEFTVPTTIGIEKYSNIFMRAPSFDSFAELRLLKDNFTPRLKDMDPYGFGDGYFGSLINGLKLCR